MLEERESYLSPVWFAREPAGERKKWIGRIFLALAAALVAWLILSRVIAPPADNPSLPLHETTIPGPI